MNNVEVKPFGFYDALQIILKSDSFLPVYIDGPTGIGKTFMCVKACENLNKKIIRVNFTNETDEDDLIGGIRLKDGDTFFEEGPIIEAMRTGSVLLLDEIDIASPQRIMCLQSILEGSGYFIKKKNEMIEPHKDFKIIATGNTKGLGDETGTYIGANIHNEAFLDRFPIFMNHTYPDPEIELEILKNNVKDLDEKFISEVLRTLVKWANKIRIAFKEGSALQHSMSTRRLIKIAELTKIIGNFEQALKISLNRYDDYHKKTFYETYSLLKEKISDISTKTSNQKISDTDLKKLEEELRQLEPF